MLALKKGKTPSKFENFVDHPHDTNNILFSSIDFCCVYVFHLSQNPCD